MGMTIIEKILARHSKYETVRPGDIVDIEIDVRAARDFGGANVVKHLQDNNLNINDPSKTFFTFDCNPTGSDQKYAINQHLCRLYAREQAIKVYDIDAGIGTHLLIQEGLAVPGATIVTTDSHANILGAVGAFGQGMGDQDIAAAWHNGKLWFKVPESVKIVLTGKRPPELTAKDIILNLLNLFGANSLLGYSVELYGDEVDKLSLDERVTIASMGTEMGVISLMFYPSDEVISYCSKRAGKTVEPVAADSDAEYAKILELDLSSFVERISRPGKPHDAVSLDDVKGKKIDSGFIGSCTNGRYEDMLATAKILENRKVAPGVVLKIVPATDEIWNQCLLTGLIKTFKEAGAMVSNPGCAGCAAGQVGQNGSGEVTVSTGNRNFAGKQGKGEVYLASPEIVAASCIAGFITRPGEIPEHPAVFEVKTPDKQVKTPVEKHKIITDKPVEITGKTWFIKRDNIDTDMIFHNRYLTITNIAEMGQYTFDNLQGYEDFAKKAQRGDIVVVGKNFGSGSSRQQAVDCFISLGIQAVIAESFGAIYERNAINAAFPIVTCKQIDELNLVNGNTLKINFETGDLQNLDTNTSVQAEPFLVVQMEIYRNGGLF